MIRGSGTALVLACSMLAQTNVVQNGSFETAPPILGGRTNITLSGSMLPGWNIINAVDLLSPFWNPSHGLRAIDLWGATQGAIEQTVPTIPGATYRVLFDLGATSGSKSIQVSAGALTSPMFVHSGPPFPTVSYAVDQTWEFVATTSTTTLRFDSPDSAHIDNVRAHVLTSYLPVGSGCPGSAGVPSLTGCSGSVPALGQVFCAVVDAIPTLCPFCFPVMLLGDALNPPVDLDVIGAPGCVLRTSPFATVPMAPTSPRSTWTVWIPNDLAMWGLVIRTQVAIPDASANPLGLSLSNAADMVLGG